MAIALVARRHAVAAVIAVAVGTGNSAWKDLYTEIVEDEGMVLKPYYDIANIRTACVGDTIEVEDKIYTVNECAELLVKRVNQVRGQVDRCTEDAQFNPLPQPTKNAFVSFTFNVGQGNFCNGSVARNINQGKAYKACGRMRLYNKFRDPQTGKLKISRGLDNRRKREANRCESGLLNA